MNQLLGDYPFIFDELDSGFSYNRIITDHNETPVDYEILFCNKKFADFMGVEKDELTGKRFSQIDTKKNYDDFDWLSFYGKTALKKGKNTVERYIRSEKRFYKIKAVSPKKNFFIVYVSDITDFKKSTSMLKEIRHRYETIFSNTEDPHAVLVNKRFQDCNDASLSMMCTKDRNYIIGKYPWDISPEFQPDGEKSEKKASQHIHKARANGSTHFEWYHKNAVGVVFPAEIHLTSVTLGEEEMIYVTWRDVTNLKEAETKREETEERFRKFTEFNPAAIMIYQNDVFVYANPAAEKISGYSLEELQGMKFWNFIHPDHKELIKNRGEARQHGEKPQKHYEFKIIDKKGFEKWVDFRAETITLSGENAGLISAVDISHRKKIEKDLRRNRKHLDITLDSIGDAVISTNKNGIITRMNPVAEKLTEWKEKEATKYPLSKVFKIINAETGDTVESPFDKVMSTGKIVGLANHTILISKNGEERQIADSGAPIKDESGAIRGVVLVFRDVTDQYKMEKQFREAQKMDAIGQLAGGVAHDFNNILSAITGATELLSFECDNNEKIMRHLRLILDAASNAADLTRKLLDFSRKGKRQNQPVNIHKLISDTVMLLERTMELDITLKKKLAAEKHIIQGDSSQLQNALLNLGINARDAMPNGGDIFISTENVFIKDSSFLAKTHSLCGEMLKIEIKDTGVGMSSAVKEQIFEPFFTTKGIGKGTGLGLSAVYGAVKEHSGGIVVESEPDKGTCFSLYFPMNDDIKSSEEKPVEETTPSKTRSILLVDDDDMVRITVSEMLKENGHKVTSVNSGKKGIEAIKKDKNIELVILDIAMPEMNGYEVLNIIRKLREDIPVILSSGYSSRHGAAQLKNKKHIKFIQKPVSSMLLFKTIDSMFVQ